MNRIIAMHRLKLVSSPFHTLFHTALTVIVIELHTMLQRRVPLNCHKLLM